jgi:hypothetical protein
MKTVHTVTIASFTVISACSSPAPPTDPAWRSALDELISTERAFARLAVDSTVQFAFLANMDEGTTIFRPGPVEAVAALAANPFPPDLALEWQPAWADLAADRSLGYTTGPWRSGRRDSGEYGGHGQYLTVWRRAPNGYLAALDWGIGHPAPNDTAEIGLADPPPPGDGVRGTTEGLQIADEDLDAALESGNSAWAEYVAGNVRWLREGAEPSFGAAALPALRNGTTFVSLGARVAGSGDFGYSWGEQRSTADPGSAPLGYYVRIWRTDADHSWKVVIDGADGG